MNNLSWILYAADVFFQFGHIILAFGIITVIVFSLVTLIFVGNYFDNYYSRYSDDDDKQKGLKFLGYAKYCMRFVIMGVSLMIVSSFIPSQKTMYMIAASEMGEVVVNSQQAKDTLDNVQRIIKGYADEFQKQSTKEK